jgi:hypothetical protein
MRPEEHFELRWSIRNGALIDAPDARSPTRSEVATAEKLLARAIIAAGRGDDMTPLREELLGLPDRTRRIAEAGLADARAWALRCDGRCHGA